MPASSATICSCRSGYPVVQSPSGVRHLTLRVCVCETVPDAPVARAALIIAFSADDKTEALWLVQRLLWAIPWPADAVPENATAAKILGAIFDQTILSRHASRPLADTWVSWAARWTTTFGAHWAELLRSTALPDVAGVPPVAPRLQAPLATDSDDPASPQPSRSESFPLTDPFLPSYQSSPPGLDPNQKTMPQYPRVGGSSLGLQRSSESIRDPRRRQ